MKRAIGLTLATLLLVVGAVAQEGASLPAGTSLRMKLETPLSTHKSKVGDVFNGLFKSFVFAMAIGIISCHQGLSTRGGPRGIGRSVTKAVVNSIVLILILDYYLTRFLLYIQK